MMNSFKRLLIPLVVTVLALFGSTALVHAGSLAVPALDVSNLTVDPVQPFVTGEHPTLTVHLTSQYGAPIIKQPILVLMDGKLKARGQTDSQGIATITLQYKFAAGTYNLAVVYPGIVSIGLPAAVARVSITADPAKLAIYTVPPTPNVVIKLNAQTYTTDKNGAATIQVNTSGTYALTVLPIDQKSLPSNVRMDFARWNDYVFTPTRQIYFPRINRLEIGFTIKYQVNQVFHDTEGKLVDPARISSMTIKGAGSTYTFNKAGPMWLPANRLLRRINEHLESDEIVYYFKDVTIDGANVVNDGEQRFGIRPDDVWPVKVLLYNVNFSAQDAIFHSPIGKGVQLTYPDGQTRQFLFNSSGAEVTVPSLARGSYTAKIFGARGSAPSTPLHLSRDQDVQLLMLSRLDMGLMGGIPLLIAIVFFFIGRPIWLRVLRHPSRYRDLVYQNTQRDAS